MGLGSGVWGAEGFGPFGPFGPLWVSGLQLKVLGSVLNSDAKTTTLPSYLRDARPALNFGKPQPDILNPFCWIISFSTIIGEANTSITRRP